MATTESQPRTRYPHSPPAPCPSATVADAAASALPPTPVSAGSPGRRRGLNRSAGAKYLSVFNIAMLTTVTVTSLRSLPTMATYGLGAVTLFVVPAVFFLLPAALVGAELAGGWKGGVYVWVRQAFSDRLGFVAIWLQWIQNVVWYPVQLAFIAGSLAFMIGLPSLSNSGVFTAVVILTLYWTATVVTLRGGNLFAKLSSWGGVIGTLIPAALLIVLGCLWLADGLPSQIPLAAGDVIPPFTGIASIVLVVSNVLSFG
ncbi:MAG: APC family permease, partial [Bifidobacteriaceae bacterium]|nr:APC family permease [Bifidobacteriaceae bacterium]